jgi:hypothetical protein
MMICIFSLSYKFAVVRINFVTGILLELYQNSLTLTIKYAKRHSKNDFALLQDLNSDGILL